MIEQELKPLSLQMVQLKEGVNINLAIGGADVLTSPTPDWINKAADKGTLSLSKQPGKSEVHLWIEQDSGQFLVRPGDWIIKLPEGNLISLSNTDKEQLFKEKDNEQ